MEAVAGLACGWLAILPKYLREADYALGGLEPQAGQINTIDGLVISSVIGQKLQATAAQKLLLFHLSMPPVHIPCASPLVLQAHHPSKEKRWAPLSSE